MGDLSSKNCVPCRGGIPPLSKDEAGRLLSQLQSPWSLEDGHHIQRTFTFPDFKAALAFTNKVGALAEEQGHHPDIDLAWGRARVRVWTHAIDGLTESDFILAAKIDKL